MHQIKLGVFFAILLSGLPLAAQFGPKYDDLDEKETPEEHKQQDSEEKKTRESREREDRERIRKEPFWAAELRNTLSQRKLQQDLDWSDKPLLGKDGALADLEKTSGCKIYAARKVLDEHRLKAKVSLKMPAGKTVAEALNGLAAQLKLKWILKNGAVLISDEADARNEHKTMAWSIKDLIRGDDPRFEPQELQERILKVIPELEGEDCRLQYIRQTAQLIVTAPPEVHDRLVSLLYLLRAESR